MSTSMIMTCSLQIPKEYCEKHFPGLEILQILQKVAEHLNKLKPNVGLVRVNIGLELYTGGQGSAVIMPVITMSSNARQTRLREHEFVDNWEWLVKALRKEYNGFASLHRTYNHCH